MRVNSGGVAARLRTFPNAYRTTLPFARMACMTHLMEQAIERLQSLPENQQDRLARFLLNELQEDDRWTASTAAHADKLQNLVREVLAEDAAGMCEPLDPDRL